MTQRSGTKRSKHELKRLIEQAVNDECCLPGRGLWFCVDEIEVFGQPPERIKVWATLHFTAQGSPFCCGEPGCHLCIMGERQRRINERVRRAMGLEQEVSIDIGSGDRIAVQYHEGVEFRVLGMPKARQPDGSVWVELSEAEYNVAWDRFCEQFKFRPSVYAENWPGIQEPSPSITFHISSVYGLDAVELESDLNGRMLAAFRHCLSPSERLYALDWQHPGYWFDPHGAFDPSDPDGWKVPVFPAGDYYIFLAADFSFGVFGHPWEQTMCIFGQKLIEAVQVCRPKLFTKVVRRDGKSTGQGES